MDYVDSKETIHQKYQMIDFQSYPQLIEHIVLLLTSLPFTVKKRFGGIPVPSRDVTYQTLPGQE